MKIVIILSIFFLVYQSLECYEIFGNFKECIVNSNVNMLEFDDECFRDPDEYTLSFDSDFEASEGVTNFPAFVFSKRNFILETKGYECKMVIHRYRYSKDFLFNKYIQNSIEYIHLSRSECLMMVNERKCGRLNNIKKMQMRNKKEYFYIDKITEEFPFYFGTIEKEFYECIFFEKIVLAQSLTESIFHNSIEPCYAEDEICYFAESSVVWEREDIRRCPFERLIELSSLSVKPKTNSTIFYSDSQQYLFKITNKENQCGHDLYLTTEGLYLSFYKSDWKLREQLLVFSTSKYNIDHFIDKDKNDLILAENDYTHFKMTEMMLDVACSMFSNTIQSNLDQKDKFLKLNYLGKLNFITKFS